MAHQQRRGTDAERQTVTFLDGEPAWANDIKRLYIGDGVTLGGIPVSAVFPIDTVVNGELQPGNEETILYVYETETMYSMWGNNRKIKCWRRPSVLLFNMSDLV